MYKDFTEKEFNRNDIMLISYNQLNTLGKKYFNNVFRGIDISDVYCIDPLNGDNSLYGYVRLVPKRITESQLFPQIYDTTLQRYGYELANTIRSFKGYEIKDWCLESQFKNSIKLDDFIKAIFIVIWSLETEKTILWTVFNDSLLFNVVDFTDKEDFTVEKEPYIKQAFQL